MSEPSWEPLGGVVGPPGPAGPAGPQGPQGSSAAPGDLIWSVAATRVGCVLADGRTVDATNATYTALWVALGSPAPQNACIIPDLRERVAVGAGPNTARLANDGVAVGSRKATRHRHTPHKHLYQNDVRGSGTYTAVQEGVSYNNSQSGAGIFPTDGGSGIAADPLDGPGYVALNPFLVL